MDVSKAENIKHGKDREDRKMGTKSINKRNWMFFAVLPMVVMFCVGFWILQRSTPRVYMESDDGVYDLTGVDLARRMVELKRTVEYIPGELLGPEEFDARDDIQTGKIPDDVRVVTMRARILVPDDKLYGVCGYAANFANRIFVNGKWLNDEGTLGRNSREEKPFESYHFFTVQPENGVIEILIQTTSFSHQDTSNGMQWVLGEYSLIRLHYLRSMTSTLMVMAWYLLMALIFLSLFFVVPQYKGNGWLALMALTWALRTGIMGNKPLLVLVPFLDWSSGYRLEKASMPLILIFLMLALHASFPGALSKWLRRVVVGVAGVLVAAALLLPTFFYSSYSSDLMRGVYVLALVITLCILWSLRKKRPNSPQMIILTGLGLILFAYGWDLIYYYEYFIILPLPLMQPMILAFSLFLLEAAMLHTVQTLAEAREREQRAETEKEMLSEMNRLKSAFYTDMSHEMKTPLTVISVNAQFAAQNISAGAVDEETVTDLNAISAEARRLAQMVTSLVGIGRMQGSSGLLSLNPLLTETARIYQSMFARKENTLTVDTDTDLPEVDGNADQLIQVLINLLSNANRHTRGGAVTIRAEALENCVQVSVTDNGEGIAQELLPHVFERFCHGEKGGSGLGLPICKTIVEEHGGEIHIESEEGKGTKVWFTLPVKG